MNNTAALLFASLLALIVGLAIGFLLGKRSGTPVTAPIDEAAALEKAAAEKARLDENLKAVTTSLATLTEKTQAAEVARAQAEATLRAQIENMKVGNETLLRETTKLAGALSNSQSRGKYGEAQLEMLLESSGLIEGVHFFKQDYRSTDARISKPDIKIAIPGGSEIFVDSKFPFERFLEAIAEKDPELRRELMQAHAKDLMGHVNALAARGYQSSSASPDYVVLFAPFESILAEALDVDGNLLNKAFAQGVTIATPTTMMALLRTVAHVFNQSDMAKNASTITELASELLQRIGKVHAKIATLGDRIKSAERAFNDLVGSAETHMLRPARKMVGLGVPSPTKLSAPNEIDSEVRAIAGSGASAKELELEELDQLDDDEEIND